MADQKKVHWDEAELSRITRWCRTFSDYKALPSPYPFNVDDDDSTDTDDTLTDEDDPLVREDFFLTDADDALIREDCSLTNTDDTLVCMDDTPTYMDDILINNDDPLPCSNDDLTDTDDTLIDKDDYLLYTNQADDVLSKTDKDSLDMAFVLSIDGGGIRGYSSLMILQALMQEIEDIERASSPTATSSLCSSASGPLHTELCTVPKANVTLITERRLSHYFDYIGGTGSGNVIAALLTDEKMSVAEAIEVYRALCAPGRPRRLIDKEVVFSKRDQTEIWLDQTSTWLQSHTRKSSKLAYATLIKHIGGMRPHNADTLVKHKGTIPARQVGPSLNMNINNASRTVLEAAHCRLLDDPCAKHGIMLLSIGGAITEPVDSKADPLRYQQSRQTRRVHEELEFRTSLSEKRNGRLFNLKEYSRLDVEDDALGDVIGVRGWGSEHSDERTRWRIESATGAYLQRKEVRDEIHKLAICLVNKRRVREGRLRGERGERGISDRYPDVDLGYRDS